MYKGFEGSEVCLGNLPHTSLIPPSSHLDRNDFVMWNMTTNRTLKAECLHRLAQADFRAVIGLYCRVLLGYIL